MRLISDLHIHSRFSRACSKDLTIPNLEKYAKIKGLNLLGTGDFTHPLWIKELKNNLEEEGSGVLKTKTGFKFILQTEISLIYSQGGKGRRIHNLILAPNLEVVSQISEALGKRGRLDYDGRPIFKIPCPEFVEMMMKISKDVEVIPAHCWTPWFALFGSNSGFDSLQECFQDQTKNIHAIETGLSSDPPMNWRLSQLDKMSVLSFSDSHSFWPWRLGREATIFDIDLSYKNILKAIRTREGLSATVEVDPNFGKYHLTGHRDCNVKLSPKESLKHKNICPKCGKPLTVGVLQRVEELADRPEGFKPKDAKPFHSVIPLSEIISTILGKAVSSKAVSESYDKLIKNFGSEFNILLDVPLDELRKVVNERLADAIIRNRNHEITISAGYDGVYGEPILDNNSPGVVKKQKSLLEF
ncbi:DNA helicase UvrD [Candidatus Woesearchaeota archaeon]|nr:DNA helicase UvrD [Candidatus Woesearchaeota archaeon]